MIGDKFSWYVFNSYRKPLNDCYYVIGSDCDINIIELLRNDGDKPPLMPRVEIKNLTLAIYNSRDGDISICDPVGRFTRSMLANNGILDDIVNNITIDLIKARLR